MVVILHREQRGIENADDIRVISFAKSEINPVWLQDDGFWNHVVRTVF